MKRTQTTKATDAQAKDDCTVYAPEFLDMIICSAEQILSDWLSKNTPEQIAQLYNSTKWLSYVSVHGAHGSENRQDTIEETIRCVNLITQLGASWSDGPTTSVRRKPVV